jgi:hypothetical protein
LHEHVGTVIVYSHSHMCASMLVLSALRGVSTLHEGSSRGDSPRKEITPLARRSPPSKEDCSLHDGEVREYWRGSFLTINSTASCKTNPRSTSPCEEIVPLARRLLPSQVDRYPHEKPLRGATCREGAIISFLYNTYFNNILSIHKLSLVS